MKHFIISIILLFLFFFFVNSSEVKTYTSGSISKEAIVEDKKVVIRKKNVFKDSNIGKKINQWWNYVNVASLKRI